MVLRMLMITIVINEVGGFYLSLDKQMREDCL